MSAISKTSTLVDVPGMLSSVERLQELGHRMKKETMGFKSQDVDNIDQIIDAMNEAYGECKKLHEKLETETIQASVLRHRLQFFPGIVQKQIKAAVESAKKSNSEEVERLEVQMTTVTENTSDLENRHAELEAENAKLHPERDRVRQEHEEIISLLNQRMAEKASKQIKLNETRDKLRETNQKILDLEDGIMNLKEDLIQERAEARMEKKRLKKAVYDTTIKTRDQKEANAAKKKELDLLQLKVRASEDKLEEVRDSITKYDRSRGKLERETVALEKHLAKEIQENKQLDERGVILAKQLEDQEADFAKLKEELEKKIVQLDEDIQYEKELNEKLVVTKKEYDGVVLEKEDIRKADLSRVAEQNAYLQEVKKKMAVKAEDHARVNQINIDMESRIGELGDTHEAIMASLSKQIEEARGALIKERKERMRLEEERDQMQLHLDDTRQDASENLQEYNKRIKEGKAHHDSLSKEGSRLHKMLKETDLKLSKLKVEFNSANDQYMDVKKQREGEIGKLKEDIDVMTQKKEKKEMMILQREPPFNELEAEFVQVEIGYETKKRSLVALKNRKLGLDDSVKQAKKEMERAEKPREQNNLGLKKKREESMGQLKASTEEMRQMEQGIFEMGCKLKTAIEENERFADANQKIAAEIANMDAQLAQSASLMERLKREIDEHKSALESSWNNDKQMEAIFTLRDEHLLKQLVDLVERTGRREQVVNDIGQKLNLELEGLDEFLKDVETRRPTGSKVTLTPVQSATSTAPSTPFTPVVRPPPQRRHPRAHPSGRSTPAHSIRSGRTPQSGHTSIRSTPNTTPRSPAGKGSPRGTASPRRRGSPGGKRSPRGKGSPHRRSSLGGKSSPQGKGSPGGKDGAHEKESPKQHSRKSSLKSPERTESPHGAADGKAAGETRQVRSSLPRNAPNSVSFCIVEDVDLDSPKTSTTMGATKPKESADTAIESKADGSK